MTHEDAIVLTDVLRAGVSAIKFLAFIVSLNGFAILMVLIGRRR